MTDWKPIESAPEDEWIILACEEFQMVTFGIVVNGKCINPDLEYIEIKNISHWMSMPEPPKKKHQSTTLP